MSLVVRLSLALALLLFVAAVGGLVAPGLYHDAPSWKAQARGVNLVDLVVALPTLQVAMALSTRGSWRAQVVWLGVLGYVLYDAVIFAFDIVFNRFFLLYVGLLSLAGFALLAMLSRLDRTSVRARFSLSTPIRSVSLYLVIVATLFFLAWMKDIIPAIINGTTPPTITDAKIPTNPVYVLDLGFLIPLYVLSAIWLVSRRAWGYLLSGVLLVLNTLLSLSIISSTAFQYANDRSTSLAVIPLFGIIAVVSIVLGIRYLGAIQGGSR